jgi:putative MATE family efflux protein
MQDLTTGSLTGHLLRTTGFMLVGMVMQTLYVLVDLYWVGQLGTAAVAAVGVGGNVTFIVLAASQALGVGTTALVSQAVGRKDHEGARAVFGQSQLMSLTAGALFLLFTISTQDLYVGALAADAETARLAHEFLFWFLPAMALQFGIVGMGAALRGTGRFQPGMYVHAGSVVLNMILAPTFVFGWGPWEPMGVAGTALATFVAVLLATVALSLYFVPTGAYLRLSGIGWRPDMVRWKAILKIGLPAGAEFAFLAFYLFIVYVVIRPFGSAAQAGFSIGMRVLQSGFLPVIALGFAVAPVAGQNFGAGHFHRVKATFREAVGLAVGAMLIFSVVAHFAPHALLSPFSNDAEVLGVGADYLRVISWSFAFSGVVFVSASLFQAIGNAVPPLIAAGARTTCSVIPLLLISRMPGFALRGIWWISVIAVLVQTGVSLWFLRREFRHRLTTPA